MPCDELKALEAERDKINNAQRMLRAERRHLKSGEHSEMKLQLQKDGMDLSRRIEEHKDHCQECKER
jgi:hypothetical protein